MSVYRLFLGGMLCVGCAVEEPLDDGGGGGGQTTGEEPGQGAASSGEALECSDFASTQDEGAATTFVVRNASDAPVWVRPATCGNLAPVRLLDAGGESLRFHGSECFPFYCEEMMDADGCGAPGCADCMAVPLALLAPGGQTEVFWDGIVETWIDLPAACVAEGCDDSCARRDVAADGEYRVQLEVFHACTGDCDADCDGGYCTSIGDGQAADSETFEVEFSRPWDARVEIVIE